MATITKTIARAKGKRYLVITAELREGHASLSDAFSITADLYEPHGTWSGEAQYRNGREADACGMLHDEILEFAPELAPLVAIHLADPSGVPMHAVANGWYFYSGDARRYEEKKVAAGHGYYARNYELSDLERAAQALHIPVADLPEGIGSKAEFEEFAESLKLRWAQQAAEARALIESLP